MVPSCLAHLAPQVTIVRSQATDYLDMKGGISRSRHDQVKKQVFGHLRSLNKEEETREIAEFFKHDGERMQRAFVGRLEELILSKGNAHIGSVDEVQQLAKEWTAEITGTEEDQLDRMLKFLQSKNSHQATDADTDRDAQESADSQPHGKPVGSV